MTVSELDARMSSLELTYWQALYTIENAEDRDRQRRAKQGRHDDD